MEEKNIPTIESGITEGGNEQYIAAIKELKEKSVSREDYLKLKQENKQLINTLVNGGSVESKVEAPVDLDDLRKKLFYPKQDLSNLEFVETTLKLRTELIKRGEQDPFLPNSRTSLPTPTEIAQAEAVAQAYQECIDYADGDSEIFTSELMRRVKDVSIQKPARRK